MRTFHYNDLECGLKIPPENNLLVDLLADLYKKMYDKLVLCNGIPRVDEPVGSDVSSLGSTSIINIAK